MMNLQNLVVFLLGVFAPTIAMAEYWISVASFKNRDSAESELINVQARSEQRFSVYGVRTAKGYFFRVIAGPYLTQDEAKAAQQAMSSRGLSSGWIWQSGATETVPKSSNAQGALSSRRTPTPKSSVRDESDSYDDDWENAFGFDEPLDFDPQDPLLPQDSKPSQEPLPEIQETLPEGYQLNKLRREARAPPTLEHMNLAVALSQTRPKLPSSSPASASEVHSRTKQANASPVYVAYAAADSAASSASAELECFSVPIHNFRLY